MIDLDELAGPHEQWCQERMHGDCCQGECECGRDERRDAIADALREEREKTRAPFLALADKAEQDGVRSSFRDFAGNPWEARIYPHDIRRAAEEAS